MAQDYYIGIDVGATNIKIGCFDNEIKLVAKTSLPTNADMGPDAMVERMVASIRKLLAGAGLGLDDICAAGMGTPGPAKYSEGIIIKSTNMPKFKNVPIRRMLSDAIGKPVVFENDANIACWGEYTMGAGRGVKDMVFFTLGTGIGGGIINAGKLLNGCGDNAAELGHVIICRGGRQCACGQKGCAEAYASANSTAKRAAEAVQAGAESTLKKVLESKGQITSKDVYEHLLAGDALAERITDETAEALAVLCISMLHVTEPQRIVFAGGMIAAGDILLNRIRHFFNLHIWNLKEETVQICFAALGEDAGIIGAAALARCEFGTKGIK